MPSEPLDVTEPAVQNFVRDLYREIVELFPDDWIHIGGDEGTSMRYLVSWRGFVMYLYSMAAHLDMVGSSVVGMLEELYQNPRLDKRAQHDVGSGSVAIL
jgi:N-acetyl-beta-hexosaminidase